MSSTKTELLATGNDKPMVTLSTQNTPDITPEKLKELDASLQRALEQLPPSEKKIVADRLNQDKSFISSASNDRLNDQKELKFTDNESKGLKDRHEKTKKMIDTAIAQAAIKQQINDLVADLHRVREGLLAKGLEEQEIVRRTKARDMTNSYMEVDPQDVRARTAKPTLADFERDLGASQKLTHPRILDRTVEVTGNVLKSKDPKALGYLMADRGHTDATFGGPPDKAYQAIKAFLDAGGEGFELEKATESALKSGYYDQYIEPFKALQARSDAIKTAKANAPNTIFNDKNTVPSEQAVTFGNIHSEQAHRDYLYSLVSSDKQAEMIMEVENRNRAAGYTKPYAFNGVAVNEYDYVISLLRNDPNSAKAFENAYLKLQTTPQQLEEFKNLQDPASTAEFINKIKSEKARAKFYEQISSMIGPDALKNQVRAACIVSLTDRRVKLLKDYPNPTRRQELIDHIKKEDKKEVAKILQGCKTTDLNEIKNLLPRFNRIAIKVKHFNDDPTHPPIDFNQVINAASLPPTFTNLREQLYQGGADECILESTQDIELYNTVSQIYASTVDDNEIINAAIAVDAAASSSPLPGPNP